MLLVAPAVVALTSGALAGKWLPLVRNYLPAKPASLMIPDTAGKAITKGAGEPAARPIERYTVALVVPPVVVPSPTEAEPSPLALYGRAHRLHFGGGAASAALGAWEQYLRHAPNGQLQPEARFNRTVCLVRLGRLEEARRTLNEIRHPGYRARIEALLKGAGGE